MELTTTLFVPRPRNFIILTLIDLFLNGCVCCLVSSSLLLVVFWVRNIYDGNKLLGMLPTFPLAFGKAHLSMLDSGCCRLLSVIHIYIHAWMYSGARHSPVKCEIELFISKKFGLWLKWICEGMMSLKELSVFSSFSHIKSRFGPSASVANEKIVMICFSWVVHRCVAIPWFICSICI